MSLEYTVYLHTPLPTDEFERRLLQSRIYAPARDESHAWVDSRPVERAAVSALDTVTQDMISDSYGFRPTIGVVYGLDKFARPEDRELGALIEIGDLLRRNAGDAYVGFAGLRTALVRRHGQTTVNDAWLASRSWLRHDLRELFGPDYAVAPVPEPE